MTAFFLLYANDRFLLLFLPIPQSTRMCTRKHPCVHVGGRLWLTYPDHMHITCVHAHGVILLSSVIHFHFQPLFCPFPFIYNFPNSPFFRFPANDRFLPFICQCPLSSFYMPMTAFSCYFCQFLRAHACAHASIRVCMWADVFG